MKTTKLLATNSICLWRSAIDMGFRLGKKAINRAIVIDFEGAGRSHDGTAPPPILLGVLRGGAYRAYFLHDRFTRRWVRAARTAEPERMAIASLHSVVSSLVEQAERENRVILHFSRHEPGLLEAYIQDKALLVRLRAVLADGKPLMVRAAAKRQSEPPAAKDLKTLAGILVLKIQAQQTKVDVGGITRSVEKSAPRGNWKDAELMKLFRLLEYNRLDLEILQKGAREARGIRGARRARGPEA
jgi:hypothetical protein